MLFFYAYRLDFTLYQCSRDISLNLNEMTNLTSPSYPHPLTYRKGTLSCVWNIALQTPSDFQIKFIVFKGSPLSTLAIYIEDKSIFDIFLFIFPSSICGHKMTNVILSLHDTPEGSIANADIYKNKRTFDISLLIRFSVIHPGTGRLWYEGWSKSSTYTLVTFLFLMVAF